MRDITDGQRSLVVGAERTSLQSLRAWQSAIGIAVRLGAVDAGDWGRTHRWGNPPRDPDLVDKLLAAVEPVISAPNPREAADVLEGWLNNAEIPVPHANTFDRITQPSAALRPAIDELLSRYGRAHTIIQRRLATEDGSELGQRTWGIDDIPQLVWPCALPEHLRESTRPDQRILRAVVSMVLVRISTDARDWVEAGAALGFPADKARNWTRYAFSARWNLKPQLIEAAHRLDALMSRQRVAGAFKRRPDIRGFGATALGQAQSPPCTSDNGVWCPCRAQARLLNAGPMRNGAS